MFMRKNWKEIQVAIATLPRKDIEALLVKAIRESSTFYQYVWVNHLDKEAGEEQLYSIIPK
jgi:hypothetical protein